MEIEHTQEIYQANFHAFQLTVKLGYFYEWSKFIDEICIFMKKFKNVDELQSSIETLTTCINETQIKIKEEQLLKDELSKLTNTKESYTKRISNTTGFNLMMSDNDKFMSLKFEVTDETSQLNQDIVKTQEKLVTTSEIIKNNVKLLENNYWKLWRNKCELWFIKEKWDLHKKTYEKIISILTNYIKSVKSFNECFNWLKQHSSMAIEHLDIKSSPKMLWTENMEYSYVPIGLMTTRCEWKDVHTGFILILQIPEILFTMMNFINKELLKEQICPNCDDTLSPQSIDHTNYLNFDINNPLPKHVCKKPMICEPSPKKIVINSISEKKELSGVAARSRRSRVRRSRDNERCRRRQQQ